MSKNEKNSADTSLPTSDERRVLPDSEYQRWIEVRERMEAADYWVRRWYYLGSSDLHAIRKSKDALELLAGFIDDIGGNE